MSDRMSAAVKGTNTCKCGRVFGPLEVAAFVAHSAICCVEITSILPRLDLGQSSSERVFQGRVLELLIAYGWLAFHDFDSRGNRAGLPDTIAVHATEGVPMWAELKMRGCKPSIEQVKWLDAYAIKNPRDTFLWFPEDDAAIRAYASRDWLNEKLWAETRWLNRRHLFVR